MEGGVYLFHTRARFLDSSGAAPERLAEKDSWKLVVLLMFLYLYECASV